MWDRLMKHEGRRKTKKDLLKLKIKKGDSYNRKVCGHKKKKQALFST
jgi:hypothetical protein